MLAHAGVETLEQLAQLGHRQVTQLPGMSPKTLAQLQDALDEHGLSFSGSCAGVHGRRCRVFS